MRICLAFAFQNEEAFLRLHLPVYLRYHFDGIVAVDGGSQDDGAAYIKSLGGSVYTRPFDWDFAATMNFLIDCCEREGYDALFRIDPDELMFVDDIAECVNALKTHQAVRVNRFNFVADRLHYDRTTYPDDQSRVFRLNCGIHYERRVHEVISVPMDERAYLKHVNIYHYGLLQDRITRTLRFVNYDRLMDGLEPLTALPPGTPLWVYPSAVPFPYQQPIDPHEIGIRAPYGETMEDQLYKRIEEYSAWYHQIEVAPGVKTPGVQDSKGLLALLDRLGLPKDMQGLRVLDIGTGDGFFAFECERRGAEVVALDNAEQSGFKIAADLVGSKLTVTVDTVYALSAEKYGQFDVILFMGLIYHLRHPLLALDAARNVAKDGALLFVEAHMIDECLAVSIDPVKTAPLKAQKDAGLWQAVERFGEDDSLTWLPSVSGLVTLLKKAAFQPSNHFGTARGIVAAVAAPDEFALYAQYREVAGIKQLWFQGKKAVKVERPHPRRKFVQGYMPPLVKATEGGIEFTIRTGAYYAVDKGVIAEVQEEYGQGLIDYSRIKKVVDIGGHLGSWTRYVKHHSPKAESVIVEPDDMNYAMMEINVGELEGVEMHHAFCGYGEGKFYLAAHSTNSGGHIIIPERDVPSAERDPHRVVFPVAERFTLEQLCSRWPKGDIDIGKFDCEGGEWDILAHCTDETLQRFKYLVGEYHARENVFEERIGWRIRKYFDVSLKPHPSGDPRGVFFAVRKAKNAV